MPWGYALGGDGDSMTGGEPRRNSAKLRSGGFLKQSYAADNLSSEPDPRQTRRSQIKSSGKGVHDADRIKASNDLAEISRKAGIPSELDGCRTAFIGDYVVGGHVPVEAINKLLTQHPSIKDITLPGMPQGSPGMYGEKTGPFTIYAIDEDGKSTV
jgi:hypothetical protein